MGPGIRKGFCRGTWHPQGVPLHFCLKNLSGLTTILHERCFDNALPQGELPSFALQEG